MKHYMQRTAVRAANDAGDHRSTVGARRPVNEDRIHPFRKYFEEIQHGDSLLTRAEP
nr:bifunctional aldehyde dehydrogenase/enoyl-CoA hydratase [Klebsiella pneumoniae]